MNCLVCSNRKINFYKTVDNVKYFECADCGSLFADPEFVYQLQLNDSHYDENYWRDETVSSRERSFGSSINRVCEVFFYSRIPIKRFIDIGTGPGYLLDALSVLAPNYKDLFYGCELFPPPPQFRTQHKNYKIGSVSDLEGKFSAGVCIEVIEHLSPNILKELIRQLANVAEDGAIFYFNSAQPTFVKNVDPNYLDPLVRGHIVSYSLKGLKEIFAEYGFTVIELPGRDWCFLVEYKSKSSLVGSEGLLTRLWTALPENVSVLNTNGFGPLMYSIGLESARCYLEHAISLERTTWAQSLMRKII
jgi:Methyltransferase domain